MRSIVFEKHGGAEVLELRETPDPTPGPGEVVVEVTRAGVNFIDTYYREGLYPTELPTGAGNEGVGTVSAVGEGVTEVAVGDRVGYCLLPGQGYRTHAVVPAEKAVPIPEGITDEGAVWVLTPKTGRDGHVEPSEIAEAAPTAGLSPTSTVTVSDAWVGARLVTWQEAR